MFIFIFVSLVFQNDSSVYISKQQFTGYIFHKNHMIFMSIKDQKKRYTPDIKDIVCVEKILGEQIESLNKLKINQGCGYPNININLKKYIRQYVGFYNNRDEKIIWINFLWKDSLTNDPHKDIIFINDGGSYYWNVEVNLTNKLLYNLKINGMS